MSDFPLITSGEAIDDSTWFDEHPYRRFRARPDPAGLSLVRRRGDVFLRTFTHQPLHFVSEADAALASVWFETAYPELLAAKARHPARKASGGRR